MTSQVKSALFVLLAFAATIATAQDEIFIELGDFDVNTNPRLALDHSREWNWTNIPASLQHIGGNGNGDYHYWGALQLASQVITDQAVSLSVFTTSNASMLSRTSRYYTFSAQQVGTYVIGLQIQSANGEIVNATFTEVVSNSGNWNLPSYSFTYLINNNGAVNQIQANYQNGQWSYTVLNANYAAGNNKVYNLPVPPLNNPQSYDPYLPANGWTAIPVDEVDNGQDLPWIISYGATYVLTQGYNNAARNMTGDEPMSFALTGLYPSWQKNNNDVWDYKFDVEANVISGQLVRVTFQATRQINATTGEDTLQVYSWSLRSINIENLQS